VAGSFAGEFEQAFEFLMSLRLRHQFRQMGAGIELNNMIDPRDLGTMEKRMLKEAFRVILSAQEATRQNYGALTST
jgi:CBS domain-containing protein